jgi:hypothetical protein
MVVQNRVEIRLIVVLEMTSAQLKLVVVNYVRYAKNPLMVFYYQKSVILMYQNGHCPMFCYA